MLTSEDIKKIVEAEREVFPTRENFDAFKEEMRKDFAMLHTEKLGLRIDY